MKGDDEEPYEEDIFDNQQMEEDDDEDIIIYYDTKNSELEIEESILASIDLSRPMSSICGENCKGLCSMCGIDLNVESCDCKHEDVDPRLEKLKHLFD